MPANMNDTNRLLADGVGRGSFAVTPNNSVDLATPIRALRVDVAGTVTFTGLDGVDDVWTCVAGDLIQVGMTRVKATGTTATGLHGIK